MGARTSSSITARLLALLVALLAATSSVVLGWAAVGSAHDDIASSTPAAGETVDEPISSVEIDFGETISEDSQMFLTYDIGGGDVENLGGTTVVTGDTTARIDFDRIDREGRYFVRYLAPVPADGHVIAGSVSFIWGEIPTDGFPILPFALLALVVLAIGAWFSYRRMLVPDDADDAVETADPA
ncbi:copper resistance protein CopC [Ilumatobacter sp.]|uniref:copper resistance CopC family protein n=1 Tax=Ilumatobacter sp. TaxID=1967498 RepID=UPI003B5284F1